MYFTTLLVGLYCIFIIYLYLVVVQVENTIRWRSRKDEEGNEVRDSNARIVKWSDGRLVYIIYEPLNTTLD